MNNSNLLEVKNLSTAFYIEGEPHQAISNVNLEVKKGEILGIVGESGSGKSVLSLSILKLLPEKIATIASGEVTYKGERIDDIQADQFNRVRGKEVAMIFQEPMTSLNPVFTIGNQLMEMLTLHLKISKKEAKAKAVQLLKDVGIPRPDKVIDEYPHQLSGGMRQRVMIAMAISCSPQLLIADEPTTALDVTVQAQILELLKRIQQETQMGVIFISHDLGVISEICDRVAVMYAGKVVETAPVEEIFHHPKHPYTKLLLRAIPRLDVQQDKLETIKGSVPSLSELPQVGCRFANRCPNVMPICSKQNVNAISIAEEHQVFCHLYDDDGQLKEGNVHGK
ncbi:ABC transporter ATP-binding protein [Staphylococcus schleiferi]|uniref:ABC transporter ATP-binding protein n=1 Tax=Staphylococcus schleiferi TaxID=1295 RepID=UPI0018889B5A|nr:ABC transporter ATP-binding protein [Staphylococcus schleiferi]MBF1993934.1 ABC transporter ATP-binding protein [Staphylococcus schleiferi]MBF2039505.1 ABC transporter ATP-binding protein [Staphylococcus schleiferi]MBF2101495.1 ABC transporter ATP-binding protein [Staphylococcus schleiferi]MBF2103657.1 ABC transporter ATP-binding protein [Staphylococcus schleiferi]MBF2105802.1 ABC transporter ATP-binding protein [Staphylococcus schleiferi]